jgi:hypothetical protein
MATIILTKKKDGQTVRIPDARYNFNNGFIYCWGTGDNKNEKKGRFRSKNWELKVENK